MHLVIYFCGTGNNGETFFQNNQYLNNPNIRTIFVEGCDKPEVCNSGLFPDLKAFAARFTQQVFEKVKNNNKVLLVNTKDLQSVGVNADHSSANLSDIDEDDPIESILLCGYSRGGVTCFEVAKELKKWLPIFH
jgi:predicted esterase